MVGFNNSAAFREAHETKGSGGFGSAVSKEGMSEIHAARPDASFSAAGYADNQGVMGASQSDGFAQSFSGMPVRHAGRGSK